MRASGILLALSSLPSPYGIGTLGQAAYDFADFLKAAGQHYWQILPLVPPGDGSSPYMSPSAFAGNPDLIDLDELVMSDLLLTLPMKHLCREDCKGLCAQCGKNLNEGDCGCIKKPVDPRLEALRKLLD